MRHQQYAIELRRAPRAKVIQRPSGSLLCTGCGAMQHPEFPSPAPDWSRRVHDFETHHAACIPRSPAG